MTFPAPGSSLALCWCWWTWKIRGQIHSLDCRPSFSLLQLLASQTGRACFYFYVGSISLFLLPSSETLLNFSLFFSPLEVQRAIESHHNTLPFHCHIAVSCFNIIQSRPQEMWMILYIILGGWLCLLGLVMLGLRFCQCCLVTIRPRIPLALWAGHTRPELRSPWTQSAAPQRL